MIVGGVKVLVLCWQEFLWNYYLVPALRDWIRQHALLVYMLCRKLIKIVGKPPLFTMLCWIYFFFWGGGGLLLCLYDGAAAEIRNSLLSFSLALWSTQATIRQAKSYRRITSSARLKVVILFFSLCYIYIFKKGLAFLFSFLSYRHFLVWILNTVLL